MSENFPLYPSMKIGISDLRVFAAFDTVFAGDDFKISTDMHIHAYYEIIAVVSGAMRMDFTGTRVRDYGGRLGLPYSSGCVSLLGAWSVMYRKSSPCGFTISRAAADTEFAPVYDACAEMLDKSREPIFFPDGSELVGLLDKMYSEMVTPEFASDAYIRLLLEEFFIAVFRQLRKNDRTSTQNILKQIDVEEQNSRYLKIENFFESRLADHEAFLSSAFLSY